jgi:hypothetical protein
MQTKGLAIAFNPLFLAAVLTNLLTVPVLADDTCEPGFAPVRNGVLEADLDADGITCELTAIDPGSGLVTIFALDNAAADPKGTFRGCPGGSSGFAPIPSVKPAAPPDRNGDFIVCAKPFSMTSNHPVIIDNNVPIRSP